MTQCVIAEAGDSVCVRTGFNHKPKHQADKEPSVSPQPCLCIFRGHKQLEVSARPCAMFCVLFSIARYPCTHSDKSGLIYNRTPVHYLLASAHPSCHMIDKASTSWRSRQEVKRKPGLSENQTKRRSEQVQGFSHRQLGWQK